MHSVQGDGGGAFSITIQLFGLLLCTSFPCKAVALLQSWLRVYATKTKHFCGRFIGQKQEEGITLKFARFCEGGPNGGALGEGRLGDDGQLLDGGGGWRDGEAGDLPHKHSS